MASRGDTRSSKPSDHRPACAATEAWSDASHRQPSAVKTSGTAAQCVHSRKAARDHVTAGTSSPGNGYRMMKKKAINRYPNRATTGKTIRQVWLLHIRPGQVLVGG